MPARALPPWTDALWAGLAGTLVAGWHVEVPALWRDEAASVAAATRTWAAFGGMIQHVDVVHAVYYAALHVWFLAVGYTPLTLRLPSVLAAGGTAAVVALLGARLGGRVAGVVAGLVAAVLPSLVWAGGEGRSYALTALLAAATVLALLHALGPHRSRATALLAWTGHAALLALTAALFLDALLLGGATAVAAALLGRGRQRAAGAVAAVVAAIAVLPLARLAAAQTGQVAWIRPATWHDVAVTQWFRSDAVAWTVLAVVVVGAVAAVLRHAVPAPALAVALPWALLPPAALLAAGLVHAPMYWPRYVTFTAPAIALLVGLAAAALPRLLPAVAVLAIAVTALPQVVADRQPRAKAGSELQLAARLVATERRPGDGPSGIVYGQYHHIPGVTTRIEEIAYPLPFRGLTDLTARGPLAESTALFGADTTTTAAVPRLRGLRTVWFLLDLDSEPKTVVPVAAMRVLGLRQTGTFRTSGSMLLRFSR
ncbi:hypothetical protein QDR37_16175 [Amnibacterium sp. CER49]|uniref:hypothetical protein n=1 Tax=Amnibacterium sp. CER49 TaxID=3039161 RepID=UPI002446C07B|nr:hypothetical protein [Amnibacterium sp. CER49]MDH2445484.1 hypothetical protein [Amnibacterium sp. CER49]